ncbi:MAG TPA: hypothetical protein ENI19_03365 [Candidatus Nealsonbacteria bacterium]|uniref:EfeO-type cupredoxin-like domain-containing protein n=1 Tax=marine sediment metagenome TaxID=412755 RepID=A0A0F9V182_9ZZZZ|nr:hypothetical protein [Candidatus Nealsonbacteria bacterium]HEB46719.1 hypothetical protein [Candidatus Nealsonbacteria bacterium]
MNKTILIIIVILVVVVSGYFLLKGGSQAPTQAPTPASGIAPGTAEEKTVLPEGTSVPEEELSPVSEVKEFTVFGTEYSFSPSSITVSAGDQVKITFRNDGSIIHNFKISELEVGTKTISPGQTDTIEFTAPVSGTYTIFCSVPGHQAAGMKGSLKVE